jgi:hypothetical protein
MKKIFFILLILSVNSTFSQFNKFGFEKCLNENGNEVVPFAVLNDSQLTLDNLKAADIKIKKVTREYIYISSTPNNIAKLYKEKKIKDFYYSFTKPVLLNDSTRVRHFVNQVHNGTNGLDMPYTGKDVIVGYIDNGCDFQHPDFKDANGNSRIIRYWDHNLPFDATRTPTEYGYGQVFDSIDLNNMIPIPDCSSGHGTTVTGAGSGNGFANGKNAGTAPDSKIIIIDFKLNTQNFELAVADGVDYIFKIADQYGLPAVVNISLGTYFGSHDGNDPASVLIENLLDEKPGRIVVSSAGNGGNFKNFHIRNTVTSTPSFFWLKNNPNTGAAFGPNTAFFDLWGTSSQVNGINFSFSACKSSGNFETRGVTQTYNVGSTIGTTIFDTIRNVNGQNIATLEVYSGIQNGAYNMFALISKIDSTDYYIAFNTFGSGLFDAWTGANAGQDYQFVEDIPTISILPEIINYVLPDSLQSIVSGWNCSEKVISVANMQNGTSYTDINGVFHDDSATLPPSGKLAPSSSIGPSRLNVMKPDITLAGDGTFSPVPICFLENPALQFRVLQDGWHAPNGGTSMASPALAGIGALYLEKCPKSNYFDFKEDLTSTAYADNFTGNLPNFAYGFGKAHALELLKKTNYSINLNGGNEFCGAPFNLYVSSNEIIDSYIWNDLSTNSTFTITATGNYSVTTASDKGCKASKSINIIAGDPVTPVISISSSSVSICEGSSVTFSSFYENEGFTPTFEWYINGLPANVNSPVFTTSTLADGDVVTCQLTSSISCLSVNNILSNSITMNVDPVLNPNITINQSANQICLGDNIDFTSVVTGAGPSPQYNWFLNNELVSTNSPDFSSSSLSNGDFVYCTISLNSSCALTNQDVSNFLIISVLTQAVISDGIDGTLFCFTPANSYQWYDCSSNNPILGETNPTFIPSKPGAYYVIATLNNCSVKSICKIVSTTSLAGEFSQSYFEIYPNPTDGLINIFNDKSSNYSIILKSLSGQIIKEEISITNKNSISIENQANGMYFVEIINEDKTTEIFKVVKK